MKKAYELREGEVIRFNFLGKGMITARVIGVEPYSTWTRLHLNRADKKDERRLNPSFYTWLNSNDLVEVIGNDLG